MGKKSTNDVINSVNFSFSFAILRRGIWTRKTKRNAIICDIVLLDGFDISFKLSFDVSMKR